MFAERVRGGERLVGALVRVPCEETVEMLGAAGLGLLVLDCEHGPADLVELRQHIALAQLGGMSVLVRVGDAEPALVLRALDQGAEGIIAPHIDSAEQAADLVASVHYPPRGRRGFAAYGRAGGFGTRSAQEHHAQQAGAAVIVMFESPAAAVAAEQILGVDGVDGYLIGTSDLAVTSGPADPAPERSIAAVHAVRREPAPIRIDLASSTETAVAAFAAGADVVLYNLTQVLMTTFGSLSLRPPG
jgi:4-hydroxy-2-oxoheptanedioate aldolase